MASIAESIIQQAFKGTEMAQESTDKIEATMRAGAQLALKKQELAQKEAAIEQQRAQLNFKKIESGYKYLEKVPTASSDMQARFFAKGAVQNLSQVFGGMHPEIEDLMIKDRNFALQSKIAMEGFLAQSGGQISADQMQQLQVMAQSDPLGFIETVQNFNKERRKEAAQMERAQVMAQATTERQREQREATAETTVAREAAKSFAKFKSAGGESVVDTRINKLDDVIKALERGEIKTGGVGRAAGGLLGRFESSVQPGLARAIGDVNSAINVKQILDSQFSDALLKETQGQLGIDRGLPTEANIKRLKDLKQNLLNDKRNAIELFKRQGLMQGTPSKQKAGEVVLAPSQRSGIINRIRQVKTQMSEDQIGQFLKQTFPDMPDSQIKKLIREAQ